MFAYDHFCIRIRYINLPGHVLSTTGVPGATYHFKLRPYNLVNRTRNTTLTVHQFREVTLLLHCLYCIIYLLLSVFTKFTGERKQLKVLQL